MDSKNILNKYFSVFGFKDEAKITLLISDDIKEDLLLLEKLIGQDKNKNDFNYCKRLIEELANKLSDEALLIKELEQIRNKIEINVYDISNGILWFQQAQATQFPHRDEPINDISEELNLAPDVINKIKFQGSLILQLYIALVYMRGGPIVEILKIGSKNKCHVMNVYNRFFNSDYLRHIRNSLSHGTFKIHLAGIYFNKKMVSNLALNFEKRQILTKKRNAI